MDQNGEKTTGPILRPPKASLIVGLSVSTLAKLRMSGAGPVYIQLSARRIGYRLADLEAWLCSRARSRTNIE